MSLNKAVKRQTSLFFGSLPKDERLQIIGEKEKTDNTILPVKTKPREQLGAYNSKYTGFAVLLLMFCVSWFVFVVDVFFFESEESHCLGWLVSWEVFEISVLWTEQI